MNGCRTKRSPFYEDTIVAVRLEDGAVYVPIRPICDNLGVALAGQRERINRDAVLSEVVASVSVTLTQQARGDVMPAPEVYTRLALRH
ncbi:MAG: phage antirepressor N-terminal domain-containing protein [Chloroflexi bacterium]|nr:phage antirepressor N-terminal domain-containing protein [Chloroflexota bacterium]